MLSAEIRNHLLVDELQLGTKLNSAVHSNERAYFNLLLSMLSNDAVDAVTSVDSFMPKEAPEDLYAKFNLLKARDNYSCENDFELAQEHAKLVDENLQSSLELSLCLFGEPLAPSKHDIAPEVMANLSPLERQKVVQEFNGESLKHEPFDLHTLDIVNAIDAARSISISV